MSILTPKKIGNMTYEIEKDDSLGMKVPVHIYCNDQLLEKMMSDRTIKQAINVSTIPGIQDHVAVLPDGHEGYGFPGVGPRGSSSDIRLIGGSDEK